MRVTCAVGGQERPEFIRQNDLLGECLVGAWGRDGAALHLPGLHHFDVIDALADPDGVLTRILLDQSLV
jgi:arylformamidase